MWECGGVGGKLTTDDLVVCAESYYARDRPLGEDLARLAGAFLGDGWIRQENAHVSGYSVGFAIGSENEPHTQPYLELAERTLPAANWRNNAAGAFGLSCSSKAVHQEIVALGLDARSRDASVPTYLFSAPLDEKRAFLAGYFDADGSVSGNAKNAGRGAMVSTSEDLVRGLRELAISCGMRVTPARASHCHTNFGACVVRRAVIAADGTAQLPLWHHAKAANQRKTKHQRGQGLQASKCGYLRLPDRTFAQRVRKVKRTGIAEPVYDLTVEHPSHAFVCEGVVVHNCWLETWQGREVVVHRKGATPAHRGVLGIVPGSQGHPSYVVRGLGNAASLHSASHGAGRQMSRKKAIQSIPKADRNAWLARHGIELLAGGMDEAPQAYKDIGEVLALQTDLIKPVATFQPELVLMAADGKSEG